jgi:DNA-binding transcriptional LysR family regulator
MAQKLNWDDVKIFLAVAEAPSMRVAAKALQVSHTTVSRRIEALEGDLGVKLFERLPGGYHLTTSGEELLPIATQADTDFHAFGRSVAGRDTALDGQVCVTVPGVLAHYLFMPIFAEFMQDHPAIQIKVDDSYELFNLSRREADVAIRISAAPPEHLIGRTLGTLHQAAYGTPDYIAAHKPQDANSTARWVGWGTPEDRPQWVATSPYPHLPVVGHFDNIILQVDAVRQGLGLGFFPCVVEDSIPELVRLSDPAPSAKVWLLSHRDLRAAARMRAFREFIFARIPDITVRLEGRSQRGTRIWSC